MRVFKHINLKTNPLVHYPFVGEIAEAPVHFAEAWNRTALRELNLKTITLFSKGGKNPEDTLEKFVFDYSNDWQKLTYSGFKFNEAPLNWSEGMIEMPTDKNDGEIQFSRHFGIEKTVSTHIQKTQNGFLFLRNKSGNQIDTTWLVGTLNTPKAVIIKVGQRVYSVDIYMPEGSSNSEIVFEMTHLPVEKNQFASAHCSVVFTKDEKPQTAYLLNDQFSQVEKIKSWKYTEDNNIAAYQEWMGASIVKDMNWKYGESQLPESLTIDRKTYFYHYQ